MRWLSIPEARPFEVIAAVPAQRSAEGGKDAHARPALKTGTMSHRLRNVAIGLALVLLHLPPAAEAKFGFKFYWGSTPVRPPGGPDSVNASEFGSDAITAVIPVTDTPRLQDGTPGESSRDRGRPHWQLEALPENELR